MMLKKIGFLLSTIFALLILSSPAAAAPTVRVNGQELSFEVAPVIENGRTLVAVRGISEALGAEVSWDGKARTVTVRSSGTTLWLQIGRNSALKNGRPVALEVAPRILSSRTMVPLRFISEALGASVSWDGATRTVNIFQAADPQSRAREIERQLFELANAARSQHGLAPLLWDEQLAEVARRHSQDMRDRGFFDHVSPEGKNHADRMWEAGISFRASAENIAAGFSEPIDVHREWMNSPGHRQNILGNYRYLGIGVCFGGPYRAYYTQNFYR